MKSFIHLHTLLEECHLVARNQFNFRSLPRNFKNTLVFKKSISDLTKKIKTLRALSAPFSTFPSVGDFQNNFCWPGSAHHPSQSMDTLKPRQSYHIRHHPDPNCIDADSHQCHTPDFQSSVQSFSPTLTSATSPASKTSSIMPSFTGRSSRPAIPSASTR